MPWPLTVDERNALVEIAAMSIRGHQQSVSPTVADDTFLADKDFPVFKVVMVPHSS